MTCIWHHHIIIEQNALCCSLDYKYCGYPERNPVHNERTPDKWKSETKIRAGISSLLQSVISRPGRLFKIPISSPSADSTLHLVLCQTFWIVTENSVRYYCFSLLKVAIKYALCRCHLATFLERYKRKKLAFRGNEFIVKTLSSSLTTFCCLFVATKVCNQSLVPAF